MKLSKIIALSCLATILAAPVIGSAASNQTGSYVFGAGVGKQPMRVNFVPFDGTVKDYMTKYTSSVLIPVALDKPAPRPLTQYVNFFEGALGISPEEFQYAASGVEINGATYVRLDLTSPGFSTTDNGNGNGYAMTLPIATQKKTQNYLAKLSGSQLAMLETLFTVIETGPNGAITNPTFSDSARWTGHITLIAREGVVVAEDGRTGSRQVVRDA